MSLPLSLAYQDPAVSLYEGDAFDFLMQVLAPGSRIVDPFAGSGTTLEAARSLGHMAAGCDGSPEVIAEAVKYLAEKALPLCPVISPQAPAETGEIFPPLPPENGGNRVLPGSAGHLPG